MRVFLIRLAEFISLLTLLLVGAYGWSVMP